MTTPKITSVETLEEYLNAAAKLEHATIPAYLTALYSIHPQTNSDAFQTIRVVVVEEMLHLTLVANVMNALGLSPDLTSPGFVGPYPGRLPDGETDFEVGLMRFCPECIDAFLKIERPRAAGAGQSRYVSDATESDAPALLDVVPEDGLRFFSIGEFYAEIEHGLRYLVEQGEDLFIGDPARQASPEYYYSGGGEIVVVTDLESACAALELIAEQGEGLGGGIYDNERELAHYYRFKQLLHRRYYQESDTPDAPPSGPELQIDWDAVYPIKTNPRLSDYPAGSELHAYAESFNATYAAFLALLTRAFNGEPELLIDAVWDMFRLRDQINQLMRNPIPGSDGVNACPTYEMPTATAKESS